ncbi:MAG: NAD(P)H-dependent oxidoreductase [Acidimicrobiales bacterium]|nr:NAD(P)H-dependent oxidoreductase [Acidimicrobiales bacterium]MCB9395700.1 NAD(P)H-dependent oxidoreductase [Acidimicrobiaceae bacterium]
MTINVGCIVGSTSSQSINRKMMNGLIEIERGRDTGDVLDFHDISIRNLPLYDYELDDDFPPAAVALKEAIGRSDALIVATPEYNRSIPGPLKNAIDWASRPYGENSFGGKPVGIIGASVGAVGTAAAQQHLRNILAYLDAPTLGQPEVFVQFTEDRFAPDGSVVDASTREFLSDWLSAYREWVGRFVRTTVG